MLYGRPVHVGVTLTDLQIFGCEVHKNAFGGPAEGAIALPSPSSRYKGEGKERMGREEKSWE